MSLRSARELIATLVSTQKKNVWKGEIKKAGNKNDVLYGTEIIFTPNLHLNIVNNMIEEIENNN
jgi:hypothetical protein